MKQLLEDLTTDSAVGFYFITCLFTVFGILIISALADHKKKNGYYVRDECVYVDVPWQEDIKSFCSDDITKTISVLKQLQGK